MEGERDLSRLLSSLDPQLHSQRFSFTATADPELGEDAFAIVREAEGLTCIRPDPAGDWARISLGVHLSLVAVGLTAAVSARLSLPVSAPMWSPLGFTTICSYLGTGAKTLSHA